MGSKLRISLQCRRNHLGNRIDILQDLVVPKSQDMESRLLQKLVTFLVTLIVQMLPTIHFHNQPLFQADEIQYVVQKRMLAAKFTACHLSSAQTPP